MHARAPLGAAVATLCVGLALSATGPGFAGTGHTRSTTFAFHGSGYGTRVIGGQVPAGSRTTAFQNINCTNQAGKDRTNDVADATVPGLGTVSGVKTRVWTTEKDGVVATHARHSIARLTLASSGVGSLSLDAVGSNAKAFHDGTGFHATTSTTVGDITLTPPAGPPQSFPAPTPGQPVEIPGLATIHLGKSVTTHNQDGATANAFALVVDVVASGSTVKVAHSFSSIDGGLTGGIFSGHSNATRVVEALDNNVHSGPNPLSRMPCAGTGGETLTKSLADLNLGGQIIVKGLSSSQRGSQHHGAHGFERARVGRLNLGGGQLVVNAIVGKAHVRRTSDGWVRTAKGTRIGSITANGQAQTFPPTGVLEIPGVARLERRVVTRTKDGIKVVALRVTILDGTGGVIDLGEAKLQISRLPH